MSKIIIHIGLHKTGTTFLQKNFFPNFTKINYCGDKFSFNDFAYKKKNNSYLISNEALSGRPWNDEWKRGIENDFEYLESFKTSINNLRSIFPEAYIVIVLRKHGDFLISLYKQYIQEGGVMTFKEFYGSHGVVNEKDLNFTFRVEYLKEKFSNVGVLSFEKFKAEGVEYYERFFRQIGCHPGPLENTQKANSSISGKKIELLRNINKYYPRTPEGIKTILSLSRFTPRRILQERLNFWNSKDSNFLIKQKNEVNEYFKKDWQSLEKLFFKGNNVN